MGILMACPHDNLAPLMAWMEESRREKARRQRSQHRVQIKKRAYEQRIREDQHALFFISS